MLRLFPTFMVDFFLYCFYHLVGCYQQTIRTTPIHVYMFFRLGTWKSKYLKIKAVHCSRLQTLIAWEFQAIGRLILTVCLQNIGSQPVATPFEITCLFHRNCLNHKKTRVLTLWFIVVAKLYLWHGNEINFRGGSHHNMRNCFKGSQN